MGKSEEERLEEWGTQANPAPTPSPTPPPPPLGLCSGSVPPQGAGREPHSHPRAQERWGGPSPLPSAGAQQASPGHQHLSSLWPLGPTSPFHTSTWDMGRGIRTLRCSLGPSLPCQPLWSLLRTSAREGPLAGTLPCPAYNVGLSFPCRTWQGTRVPPSGITHRKCHQCPGAAVTKDSSGDGREPNSDVLAGSGGQNLKSGCQLGRAPSRGPGAGQGVVSFLLSQLWGLLVFPGRGPITPGSASILTWPPPCLCVSSSSQDTSHWIWCPPCPA